MSAGHDFADLVIAQRASLRKTVTEADIALYAGISLDTNPIHIDAESAAQSVFGERIAPGMLVASLISAVIGTSLPGPGTTYLDQTLQFLAPVRIGDTVTATVEILALNADRKRAKLKTTCSVGGRIVIDGIAYVQVPSRG